jgi:tryptophan-rich sensory protein
VIMRESVQSVWMHFYLSWLRTNTVLNKDRMRINTSKLN